MVHTYIIFVEFPKVYTTFCARFPPTFVFAVSTRLPPFLVMKFIMLALYCASWIFLEAVLFMPKFIVEGGEGGGLDINSAKKKCKIIPKR